MDELRYLTETLCWMGGTGVWPRETIAEQLGREDDPIVLADLARAEREGLIEARGDGVVLTEAGWALAESCGD